jgi:hypothetical protein
MGLYKINSLYNGIGQQNTAILYRAMSNIEHTNFMSVQYGGLK